MKANQSTYLITLAVAAGAAWFHWDNQEKDTYVAKDLTTYSMAAAGMALLYAGYNMKGGKGMDMMIVTAVGAALLSFNGMKVLKK